MEKIKVSVILPSLNVAKYIRKCLESVVCQTLREIEIICVDGGSADGTTEIISEFAARDSRIVVIHADKKSYGYQVNLGMDAAQGKYVGIVETDDYILSNMYESLYRVAEDTGVDTVKSDWVQFYDDAENGEKVRVNLHCDLSYYSRVIRPRSEKVCFYLPLSTWNGVYRRDFLRKHNIRHNESSGASYQDNGFYFQTMAYAESVYLLRDAFYMLRRNNPNSSIVNTGNMHRILGEFHFMKALLGKDEYLYKNFRYEFGYLLVQNGQWLFERMLYNDRKEFLYKFVSELKDAIADDCIDYGCFEDRHLVFLFKLLHNLPQYMDREIGDIGLLQRAIAEKKRIFIYGLKNRGRDFLYEVQGRFPYARVQGFVVSKRNPGETLYCGQKVYELSELSGTAKDSLFIIAVRTDKVRKEIAENLRGLGFDNILCVAWQYFWHMYMHGAQSYMLLKKYEE